MSKDDLKVKRSLSNYGYCEDMDLNISKTDCLPPEDSVGAAMRKSVLTGLAKTSCTTNPLEAWAATEAKDYNHLEPRCHYDWEAIAAKLHASSSANDENMAQVIASKQIELKPSIKDEKFTVDGKLGPKTIKALELNTETTVFAKTQLKQRQKTKRENSKSHPGQMSKSDQSKKQTSMTLLPVDEKLKIKKQLPKLKEVDEGANTLNEKQIQKAIKENNILMKKYKGDKKFEQERLLKSVGSHSNVFDNESVLKIAEWQQARGITPNGIYNDECRKVDFLLTVYDVAADNTDVNILFVVSQLSYESGYKFSKINNYGGIKAPTENGRGLKPLDPAHASLQWTHENWTDSTYKQKEKDYENDPNRSIDPASGKKITYKGVSKHGKGKAKYRVQEYFRVFDSLEDFIQNHRTNIVNNVTKKVTKMKDSGQNIYEADQNKQVDKIKTIIQDADAVLQTIQSGKSFHYATSEDYVDHISDRMKVVSGILNKYNLTPARVQNSDSSD